MNVRIDLNITLSLANVHCKCVSIEKNVQYICIVIHIYKYVRYKLPISFLYKMLQNRSIEKTVKEINRLWIRRKV